MHGVLFALPTTGGRHCLPIRAHGKRITRSLLFSAFLLCRDADLKMLSFVDTKENRWWVWQQLLYLCVTAKGNVGGHHWIETSCWIHGRWKVAWIRLMLYFLPDKPATTSTPGILYNQAIKFTAFWLWFFSEASAGFLQPFLTMLQQEKHGFDPKTVEPVSVFILWCNNATICNARLVFVLTACLQLP